MDKAETVFSSWLRQDGRATTSPSLHYTVNSPVLWNMERNDGKRGISSRAIAVRLTEFTILYPTSYTGQSRYLLRDHGAVEMFDHDFNTVKGLIDRRNLENNFPHMPNFGASGRSYSSFRNAEGKKITAKKALVLKHRGEVIQENMSLSYDAMPLAEELHEVLSQYGVESPYGRDSYDLMRYFNRVYFNNRYTMALYRLERKYHEIDLESEPLLINQQWTFIEQEVDAMMLMISVPFKEKVYLRDW